MNKLKHYRKAKNISQEKLAEMSKVDPRTINRIEKEPGYVPSGKTLEKIASALEISIDDILCRDSFQAAKDTVFKNAQGDEIGLRETPPEYRSDPPATKSDIEALSDKLDILLLHAMPPSNVIDFEPYFRNKQLRNRPLTDLNHEHWKKAAGAGSEKIEDLTPEEYGEYIEKRVSKVPDTIDFSVPISGKSMQPTIRNGAIVYCRKILLHDIKHDDLVLFVDDSTDEFKLRRVRCFLRDNEKLCILGADNLKYTDTTLLDENIRIAGVVIYCSNEV